MMKITSWLKVCPDSACLLQVISLKVNKEFGGFRLDGFGLNDRFLKK